MRRKFASGINFNLQTAVERIVINFNLLLLLIDDMTWLTGADVNAGVILVLDLLQPALPHGDVDAVHLALLQDRVSVIFYYNYQVLISQ